MNSLLTDVSQFIRQPPGTDGMLDRSFSDQVQQL